MSDVNRRSLPCDEKLKILESFTIATLLFPEIRRRVDQVICKTSTTSQSIKEPSLLTLLTPWRFKMRIPFTCQKQGNEL